jgi:hypothetical protein
VSTKEVNKKDVKTLTRDSYPHNHTKEEEKISLATIGNGHGNAG